jgi:hypothetical protein
MTLSILLVFAIFIIALVLTMVGLGGGLIFSPLFVILGFAKADAASASLFLNLVAAASAAYTYSRKKMVEFTLAIPLIVSASLAAPVGSYFNSQVDAKPFMIVMAVVLALAGVRMLMATPKSADAADVGSAKKIAGGLAIGVCIGLLGRPCNRRLHRAARGFSGNRRRGLCRAASHLRAQNAHQNRGGLFDFHRLFFFAHRLSRIRRHGPYRLALHFAGGGGLLCRRAGRGQNHEHEIEGQNHPDHFQLSAVCPLRKAPSPDAGPIGSFSDRIRGLFFCSISDRGVERSLKKCSGWDEHFLTIRPCVSNEDRVMKGTEC